MLGIEQLVRVAEWKYVVNTVEKWLNEMRDNRGIVCITNKHTTSRTCLYCFQKYLLFIKEKDETHSAA